MRQRHRRAGSDPPPAPRRRLSRHPDAAPLRSGMVVADRAVGTAADRFRHGVRRACAQGFRGARGRLPVEAHRPAATKQNARLVARRRTPDSDRGNGLPGRRQPAAPDPVHHAQPHRAHRAARRRVRLQRHLRRRGQRIERQESPNSRLKILQQRTPLVRRHRQYSVVRSGSAKSNCSTTAPPRSSCTAASASR